jgi:hypothetical protein
MEDGIVETIEKIIDLIENNNCKAYMYDKNRFHVIDKENNIDFEAKLAFNNYYYKDNINKLTYIKTKKYLGNDFTVQQILIEDENNNEKCYYSYLECDSQTSLICVIRNDEKNSLICSNNEIVNHSWKDILEYAKETFEPIDNSADIADEDDVYFDVEDDEDINDDYEEDEMDEIDDDIKDDFEEGIKEILNNQEGDKEDNNQESSQSNSEYENSIQEFYKRFKLLVNKNEVDGKAKVDAIVDLEVAVMKRYADSILLDEAVGNLKAVLDSIIKSKEHEK